MQSLMRVVCLGYLLFLTLLLLVSDPMGMVSARGPMLAFLQHLMPMAHMLSFGVLAMLGLAARWPIPRWGIAVLLVFYAGMTEIAQSLLPPRTAELQDWLQDLAGIILGAVLCWIIALMVGALLKPKIREQGCSSLSVSDHLEIARNVLSRSAPRGESWWG
jgi:hypothetical protein